VNHHLHKAPVVVRVHPHSLAPVASHRLVRVLQVVRVAVVKAHLVLSHHRHSHHRPVNLAHPKVARHHNHPVLSHLLQVSQVVVSLLQVVKVHHHKALVAHSRQVANRVVVQNQVVVSQAHHHSRHRPVNRVRLSHLAVHKARPVLSHRHHNHLVVQNPVQVKAVVQVNHRQAKAVAPLRVAAASQARQVNHHRHSHHRQANLARLSHLVPLNRVAAPNQAVVNQAAVHSPVHRVSQAAHSRQVVPGASVHLAHQAAR
jgi:hypothetical protein